MRTSKIRPFDRKRDGALQSLSLLLCHCSSSRTTAELLASSHASPARLAALCRFCFPPCSLVNPFTVNKRIRLLLSQSTARSRVLRGRDRVRSFCSVFQTCANGEIQGVAGTLILPMRLATSLSSISHRMTATDGDDLLFGSIRVKWDVSSIMTLALSIILPA